MRSRKEYTSVFSSNPNSNAYKLAQGCPYVIDCPKIPPTLRTVTSVTRTVEVVVVCNQVRASSDVLIYGNAATPCFLKVPVRTNNASGQYSNVRYEFGFTYNHLIRMLSSRFSRSAAAASLPEANIYPNDIFSYIRLDRVRAWGPTGNDIVGFPIQLTVYNSRPCSKASQKLFVNGICSERAIGDRHNRAAIAITNPAGSFVPVAIEQEIYSQMHVINCVIGWNIYDTGTKGFEYGLQNGDILAVLHITLSGQCGRDVSSLLN